MQDAPIEGIFFRDFTSAHIPEIMEEIYLHKIYEPYILGKKDLIIADLGGNIGLTSYYFSPHAKQVYCIEPAKAHQETIKKMLDFNKITNVTICPYAVSNKNETLKFYHNPNTTAHSLEFVTKEFEEVEAITFDEFMTRNKLDHIDLLKADPEGSEAKIFSSEGFKKYADKIDVIVGEYHIFSNVEPPQFANILRDLGFDFNWINGTKAACYSAVRL